MWFRKNFVILWIISNGSIKILSNIVVAYHDDANFLVPVYTYAVRKNPPSLTAWIINLIQRNGMKGDSLYPREFHCSMILQEWWLYIALWYLPCISFSSPSHEKTVFLSYSYNRDNMVCHPIVWIAHIRYIFSVLPDI